MPNFATYDINVNAICPGVTSTPLQDKILSRRSDDLGIPVDELKQSIAHSIPLGRMCKPEDIAAMAVFLADLGGRNITGQCLNVDGGLIMH